MKTVISVKTDQETKDRAQAVAKSIGIPLSTLINAYLREIVATGKVEFSATEPMTPQLEKRIEEVEAEIARGETYGPFDSVDEMMASLHKNVRQKNSK